ncbi:unnamed protein product [Candida verbasci]|uniref:RNA polymerase II subunit B1 CTD phosphatase RPAP2 homolog n=1 Tax=Candida verbasci TaxID=1227364 RepID=A0A9W4XCI1_9ASCO|nr:unnamed protein product [Candida verbasci]
MASLTLNDFISQLSDYHGKETMTSKESSNLQIIIVELLIDNTISDFKLFKFLSRYLTLQFYNEIIEERNIEHKCGYFMCNNTNSNQLYNRKPSMVLPMTWKNKYCCKEHYQSSIFYEKQLGNEMIMLRDGIFTTEPFPENKPLYYENNITCLEEIINEQNKTGKSLSEIIELMSGLTIEKKDNTGELIKLVEDFELVEKNPEEEEVEEEEEENEEYITTDKSFGGYVV